jgi:hypothetical protein
MNAKSLAEAESPKQFIKRAMGPAAWLGAHSYDRTAFGLSGEVYTKVFNSPRKRTVVVVVSLYNDPPGGINVEVRVRYGSVTKDLWSLFRKMPSSAATSALSAFDKHVTATARDLSLPNPYRDCAVNSIRHALYWEFGAPPR